MTINGFNGHIGVEPYLTTEVQVTGTHFKTISQKHNLTPLKVLFGNDKVPTGSVVYVMGETCKMPHARNKYELNGTTFILLPEPLIALVEYDKVY